MSTKAKMKDLSTRNTCPFHPGKPVHFIKYVYVVAIYQNPKNGKTTRKNQPIGTLWCPFDPPTQQYLPSEYLKEKRKIEIEQATKEVDSWGKSK